MPDIYKIGVEIVLADTIMTGLGAVASKLLGIDTQIKGIKGGFDKWGPAVAAAATAIAATAIIDELVKIENAGEKVVNQLELMKTAGDASQLAENLKAAYSVSNLIKTTTSAENLKHLGELSYAFGDAEKARAELPNVARANAILENINPAAGDQVWEFVKSLEEKGAMDPETFNNYLNGMTQAVIASRGKVTPRQFFSAFKYGRTAKYGWDEEFTTQYLPRLIQEYASTGGGGGSGAGGPGNALMSAFQAVVGGKMTGKSVQAFKDLGLVADESKLQYNAQGAIKGILPGGIAGNDTMISNPYKWVQEVLAPALLKKEGGKTPGEEQTKALITDLMGLYGNRTAADIITNMVLQGKTVKGDASLFEKDASRARQAWQIHQAQDELSANSPAMIHKAFTAQWEAMMEALGTPMVGPAMEAMKKVTDIFTSISQAAGAHPEAIEAVGRAIVAIGGVMFSIVTGGALIGPISQLTGLTDDMKRIGEGLSSLGTGIANFFSKIAGYLSFGSGSSGPPGTPRPNIIPPDFGGFDPMSGMPYPQRQNYVPSNTGGFGNLLQNANFAPPSSNQKFIVVHTALNIDGATLAREVEGQIAELHELPDAASSGNGVAFNTINDWNPGIG